GVELGEQCRLDAIAGLVAGPELISERFDYMVGGHPNMRGAILDHLQHCVQHADDALASAAHSAAADEGVQKVCIWTPDKDLAQCVRGDHVVQVDRRTQKIRDAGGVREKFGVGPALIPDFLALVGDAADGYPGLEGIGLVSAARLLGRYGPLESFPPETLGKRRELALLFKNLATLRTDARLFDNIEELRWHGPTKAFERCVIQLNDARLLTRALKAHRC
ncbi:MAG: hypothetical protein E5Y60_25400, partial [Mesorhizobium sp.]